MAVVAQVFRLVLNGALCRAILTAINIWFVTQTKASQARLKTAIFCAITHTNSSKAWRLLLTLWVHAWVTTIFMAKFGASTRFLKLRCTRRAPLDILAKTYLALIFASIYMPYMATALIFAAKKPR